jgi:hypothetical protein
MLKKVTSMTVHQTANGEQVAFSYSLIDADGNIITQNKRAEVVILEENVLSAVEILREFVNGKIPD